MRRNARRRLAPASHSQSGGIGQSWHNDSRYTAIAVRVVRRGWWSEMHATASDLPTVMETPDAVVQQQSDFGDATEFTTMSAERMRFAAGTDISPLLEGLPDDACQVPHWGYVMDGVITIRYTDGSEEVDEAGDVFYWPPGHTARVDEDAELVMFSPQDEHREVFEHMASRLES